MPNLNSDFGFTLASRQSCLPCLPCLRKMMIPLAWTASDRPQGVFLYMKHFIAFIVSHYLSFKSCLSISEDQEYVNIKTPKIYDLFCMNVQCIFLKHAHWDFKKDSWVILGLISGNCIYWHQRKLQFFTKVLMTWGLVACCLSKTGCGH